MSNSEERYARAIQSGHLEVTEFAGDIDQLVAAGWILDGLATTIYRLRVEFDACDMRSIRPFPPDQVPLGHGDEVWDDELALLRDATEEEREASVRRWQIAEKARVQKDYSDRRMMAKALALVHMKSLPAARNALARFVMAQATRQKLDLPSPQDELRLAGRILDYILDPGCDTCFGVKFKLIPGTGRLSKMACGECDGTGLRPMRCLGRNQQRASDVKCMCDACVLARSILADIERKMDRVNKLMHRFTREVIRARKMELPPGATAARPRIGEDGRVFYEYTSGKGWWRATATEASV